MLRLNFEVTDDAVNSTELVEKEIIESTEVAGEVTENDYVLIEKLGKIAEELSSHNRAVRNLKREYDTLLQKLKSGNALPKRVTDEVVISGGDYDVFVSPSSSRSLDTKKVYNLLVEMGREADFWDTFCNVPITRAEKYLGEKVLEEHDAVVYTEEPPSVKIKKH